MNGYITIDGLKTSYQKREGSGKTIVFLHNSSGSSALWDPQWDDQRFKDYTLIRFDLPGHGRSAYSSCPEKDYTLSGMAQMLLKVIKHLEAAPYVLAAASLATSLTGENADRLEGCSGFFMEGASVIGGSITPADILLTFTHGSVLFEEGPSDEALQNYVKGLTVHHDPQLEAALISDYRNADPHYRSIIGASIAAGCWSDEMQNLKNTGKPVAWIFGKNEQIIDAAYLNKLPADKWKDKICFIEDAGHLVNLDQPESFSRLLLEFADEVMG